MNLEELNRDYLKLKRDLEQANNAKGGLETRLTELLDDKTIQQGKVVEAKRNGDDVAKRAAVAEVARIDSDIEQVRRDAQTKLQEAQGLQAKIDEKITEIQANPEMKKYLGEVLSKKYDRKISKLTEEKEKAQEEKNRFDNLQNLITEHPALGKNLKGILNAQKEIDKLNEELRGLDEHSTDPVVINKRYTITNISMPDAVSKLSANKDTLMAYITKKSLDIKEEDINKLYENGLALNSRGEIDLKTTMNKRYSGLNRQIKGFDKSIRHHQAALAKHAGVRTPTTPTTPAPTTPTTPTTPAPTTPAPTTPTTPTTPAPTTPTTPIEEKPKWWQFIKRFENWRESRNRAALPEPTTPTPADPAATPPTPADPAATPPTPADPAATPPTPTPPTPTPANPTIGKSFKNSLKYDIVKDIVAQMEKDERKQAKAEVRREDSESR